MFPLFTKAGAGLNLTPGERAVLKLIQGAIIAGALAVLPVLAQGILAVFGDLGQTGFQWTPTLLALLVGVAHAFADAITKYWKAHADAPIVSATPPPAPVAVPVRMVSSPPAPVAVSVSGVTPASFGTYPSSDQQSSADQSAPPSAAPPAPAA